MLSDVTKPELPPLGWHAAKRGDRLGGDGVGRGCGTWCPRGSGRRRAGGACGRRRLVATGVNGLVPVGSEMPGVGWNGQRIMTGADVEALATFVTSRPTTADKGRWRHAAPACPRRWD